jgi:hypothetical protein
MAKVNVYVDGFNLYCGAVKGSPYQWLDLGSKYLTQCLTNCR